MDEFKRRVDMAAEWFTRNAIEAPNGGMGWGWVPDVPPNPQNTAEIVCVLTRVDRPIPHREATIALIREESVAHTSRGNWVFRSLIDKAWRLRGLRCLVDTHEDEQIVACAKALVEAQSATTGGWHLAAGSGPESITATCMAVVALLGLETNIETEPAVQAGLKMLVDAVLDADPRVEPLYASAQIVQVLARPEIVTTGGRRVDRARRKALERVMAGLERGEAGIEEEVFVREGVTDIWRHMTLPLSLAAQAEAAPDLIFEPGFRRGLIDLLDLQECGADSVNLGGFRTSREGFVTSYATTQALHALAAVDSRLKEQVNPGRAFDLLCRSSGTHHSDPQKVFTLSRQSVVMNSGAGMLVLALACLGALTIGALTIATKDHIGGVGSRLLLTWSAIFLGAGAFAFASVRWPEIPSTRMALVVFTVFTAIFLPIVFFVFA